MGNEGSVPQGEEGTVDEQLDAQAKAPPSATLPPGLNGGNSNGMPPGNGNNGTGAGGGNGKGRLMGSVFTRRGNAHNQNSTGIERTVEVAASYPPSHYSQNNGTTAQQVMPMPGEELTYMNPASDPDMDGGGGDYYQQQPQPQQGGPPPPQQPMYMQQQQQQKMQPQHVIPNQQYYNNHNKTDGTRTPEVGVMYASTQESFSQRSNAGTGNTATATATTSVGTIGKKSRRAGAGLISSMRNLSLGFGSGNAHSPARRQLQQQAQQVNEWETRWDEDDDEEDEEDEEDGQEYDTGGDSSSAAAAGMIQPPPPLHPQMRPDMDGGYASAQSAVAGNMSSPMTFSQQQPPPKHMPFVSPQAVTAPQYTTTPQQKAHLVTATPEAPAPLPPQRAPHRQMSDDGVEWDTGMEQQQPSAEKPNVEQFLPLLRVLGKGSFGKVVLVQKRFGRETGSMFAMKILKKSHLVRRRQIERTRTERKVLSVVNHPFIMKLHYAFQSPDKLYLVLDYCPGGELFFHLSRFRRFPERVARFYSAELLLALGHLHKRGIIYRDLKPENVLLDADGHVKLGDFGLAKAGIRHAYEGATSMCGTPEYMAPEVLAQQGHGFCVDYWGLGMLTYEMMTGLPPWYTTDRAKLFRRLRSAPLDIPPYFSHASATFSSALLERNPRRRLGVTGIRAAMEHEFFKSISWRALYGRRVEAPIRPCEGWSPPEANNSPPNSQQQQPTFQSPGASQMNGGNTTSFPDDLDKATANFDNQFTRMPVETDDNGEPDDDEDLEELHEDTFVGFTFDDNDRDELEAAQQAQRSQQQQQQQARQRTHHYEGGNGNNQGGHTLD